MENMMGHQAPYAVRGIITDAPEPASGILAVIVGVVVLLYRAFGLLASSVQRWGKVKQRFFSFGVILAVGFLLMLSPSIGAASAATDSVLGGAVTHGPLEQF
jgi:hypothetical protein